MGRQGAGWLAVWVVSGVMAWWGSAWAAVPNGGPGRDLLPPARGEGPDQPVNPSLPTLERRPVAEPAAPPAPPPPPFQLTPQEQAEVERVLQLWEQRSGGIKTFECRFKRWIYDPVFGPKVHDPLHGTKELPRFEDLGIIKYAAPDKGVFQVTETVREGRQVPIEPNRTEHWMCNGKSIFEYNYVKKELREYPLPPELQGKAIANSPLPFLFGSRAEELKRRYFIRILNVPEARPQQIWIEAYPRFQEDAANFQRATLVLTKQTMLPFALELVLPNGKNRTSYQFFDVVVNDPLRFFKGDPFQAALPRGWQRVVEEPRASQATHVSPANPRR